MFILGVVLALTGIAGTVWCFVVGPLVWAPFTLMLFCFGCLICGLASVRYAIEKGTEQIVQAINRKPIFPLPDHISATPIAQPTGRDLIDEVNPTPHPQRRRPSFEELTGKPSS